MKFIDYFAKTKVKSSRSACWLLNYAVNAVHEDKFATDMVYLP